ncbi:DUF4184 family protein [Microbacterium sp. LTA6]|uniref:DUF4184 family protein n=1 Tax=Microbacterium sp. LTA6 TaxID=3129771 RepID=UPI00324CED63
MPFTPSHAVIALPFIRTPLVPSAIAIGAMTPDLPLFLRGLGVSYSFTHTIGNVLWTALLAFGLFILWRVVLRPAVPELVPVGLARSLPSDWTDTGLTALRRAVGIEQSRGYPVLLALSFVLGVLSHIAWDLFTHEGRGGVELIPALDAMWGPLRGYKWLQHGSSVIGLVIIAVWALLRLRRATAGAAPARVLPSWVRIGWWVALPVVLIAAWGFGLAMLGPLNAEFTAQHLAYRVLPSACAVWGGLTLMLCLVLPVFRRTSSRASKA